MDTVHARADREKDIHSTDKHTRTQKTRTHAQSHTRKKHRKGIRSKIQKVHPSKDGKRTRDTQSLSLPGLAPIWFSVSGRFLTAPLGLVAPLAVGQ